jgi:CheY-like chemotaxis protein
MREALIIEDEPNERLGLSALLDAEGFRTRTADSLASARRRLAESVPELVLLDLSLPDGSGLELMEDLGGASRPDIIVLTGHATVDSEDPRGCARLPRETDRADAAARARARSRTRWSARLAGGRLARRVGRTRFGPRCASARCRGLSADGRAAPTDAGAIQAKAARARSRRADDPRPSLRRMKPPGAQLRRGLARPDRAVFTRARQLHRRDEPAPGH